jgi:hypothetical protein
VVDRGLEFETAPDIYQARYTRECTSELQSSMARRLHMRETPDERIRHSRLHRLSRLSDVYMRYQPRRFSALASPLSSPKTTGLHTLFMSQLMSTKAHVVRIWTTLRSWTVPQDGLRRYLYDIWQPLIILVLTASFACTFFAVKDPYASTSDLFYCNADGTVQMREAGGYKPFWDPKLLFTINVSAGDNLSFTQAKLVDAVWDLGVGRGGQMLAGVVTYRVLRRSLMLTMESCTIAIPTLVSVCCQQANVLSSWNLLRDISSSRSSQRFPGKRLSRVGRRRLLMQLFACIYVLTFPTLASVMTGYRTGFEGVFGYDPGSVSQVKPLAELGWPQMVVRDGSRVGLPDLTAYSAQQLSFPPEGQPVNIADLLLSSVSLEEPAGVLLDCKCSRSLANPARYPRTLLMCSLQTILRAWAPSRVTIKRMSSFNSAIGPMTTP